MSDSNGTELILSGIAEDARHRIDELMAEAQTVSRERIEFARKKAESIRKEAHDRAGQQAEQVRRTILSGITVTLKREKMRMQDELYRKVLARVRDAVAQKTASPGYRAVLVRWIAEAAAGLGAEAASVNASAAERALIDGTLLDEAAGRVRNRTNRTVHLSVSDAPPLAEQGVVLTAADGRTAFNSQVTTRMRYMDRNIRNLVYDALFPSGKDIGASDQPTD